MGQSAREQQALDSIKDWLARSDPRLVALLTTFTRLASHEEMPARDPIRAGSAGATGCPCGRRRCPHRARALGPVGRMCLRLGVQHALIAVWMLITGGLITLGVVLGHGGGQGAYAPLWAVSGAASTSVHGPRPTAHKTPSRRAPGAPASTPAGRQARALSADQQRMPMSVFDLGASHLADP
jgi:hypothetical protein